MTKRYVREGFTLVEVLVATALVGLVLGLATKGFMEMKKLTDLTTARTLVRDEATRAVRTIETLMRRSHIIYFNGGPLALQGGTQALIDQSNFGEPARTALPELLYRLGYTTNAAANAVPSVAAPAVNRFTDRDISDQVTSFPPKRLGSYRFAVDPDTRTSAGTLDPSNYFITLAQRLKTSDTTAATDFDQYFPAPLAYFAEATFNNGQPNGTGMLNTSYVPVSWTFYVLYLAPMDLKRDRFDPQIPVTGNTRDQGTTNGTRWERSTVPYQLRLLTVPNVPAVRAVGTRAATFGRRTNGERKDFATNQPMSVARPADPDNNALIRPPYDVAQDNVNYDPIPLPMTTLGASSLTGNSDSLIPPEASRERVNDGAGGDSSHPNFNNIGNDPPHNAVFNTPLSASAAWAAQCTDKVLASYVDPDSIHGTCVRLYDHAGLSTGRATASNRRWFNAYEYGSSTLATRNQRGFLWRDNAPPPRRVLISVSTRYRPSRQLPFQFHTESVEVELEALLNYQSADRTKL